MIERFRTAVPLAALALLAIGALVLAARSGYALCGQRVTLPAPGDTAMSGMTMDGMTAMPAVHGIMICPIVLWLIVASALLAGAAVIVTACDPHRDLTNRRTLRAIAHLDVARIAPALALAALAAGSAMDMVAADPLATPAARLLLAAIAVGGSLVLTLLAQTIGRLTLALGAHVFCAVLAPLLFRPPERPSYLARRRSNGYGLRGLLLSLRTHGLRAPPPALRSAVSSFT